MPDTALLPEPAAAPLLIQRPRPGKAHQRVCLFVAAALDGVLVADISLRGEERYAFYRWPGAGGSDRLRSPVLVGDRVLLVSEGGEVLALPFLAEMDEDFRGGDLAKLGRVEGVRCFAPTAVKGHLVCQLVPAEARPADAMQLGAFCWNPQDSGPPVPVDLGMKTSESIYQGQSRWSCPAWNGNALLLNDMFAKHLVIWTPGGTPNKIDLSANADPPERIRASLLNNQSIVYDNRLLSFDRYNRVLASWRLLNCHVERGLRLPFPPLGSGDAKKQALLCPPIAHGRLLVLMFKDHMAMMTVDFI